MRFAIATAIRRLTVLLTAALLASCGESSGPPAASSDVPTPSTPSAVVALSSSNFAEIALRGDKPCMVEFYSPTCIHCQRMEPIVERLARDYAGRAVVGRIDVNLDPGLVSTWRIPGWPTFLFFRNGQEVARQVGTASYDQLAGMMISAIGG